LGLSHFTLWSISYKFDPKKKINYYVNYTVLYNKEIKIVDLYYVYIVSMYSVANKIVMTKGTSRLLYMNYSC